MANELVITGLNIAFTKVNSPSVNLSPASVSITVTGALVMDNVQAVSTVAAAIVMGGVTSGGVWFMQNLSVTNSVGIRATAGAVDLVQMQAGEWACFRSSITATAPQAIAYVTTCNVRMLRFDR